MQSCHHHFWTFLKKKSKVRKLELLYRSSRDGNDIETVISKIKNKEATISIVESIEGEILGGYAKVPWPD